MSSQTCLTRRSFLRAGAIGAAVTLAACTPQVVEKTVVVKEAVEVEKEVTRIVKEVAAPEAGEIVIRYHARSGAIAKPSGSEWPLHLDAVEEFMDANPGIKVVVEDIPTSKLSDFYAKLTTMLASGTVGDFTWCHTSDQDLLRLAYMQAFAAIDDFVEAEQIDLTEYFVAAIDGCRFEGKLYALPFTMHAGGSAIFFYNKDLFEANSLDMPSEDSTQDDIKAWARALSKGKELYGFRPNLGGSQNQESQLRQFGTHPVSEDGKSSQMNVPKALDWAKFIYEYYDEKLAPLQDDMPTGGLNAMFAAQKLAMFQNGPWAINSAGLAVGDAFEIGMMPIPKGPSGLRGYGGYIDGWALTTQSKHKAEAFKAMHGMASFRSGVLRLSLREGLTAMPSVYEDAQFADNARAQLINSVVKQCLAQRHPWNFRGAEHASVLQNELDLLWLGKAEPTQSFMDTVASKADTILRKPR